MLNCFLLLQVLLLVTSLLVFTSFAAEECAAYSWGSASYNELGTKDLFSAKNPTLAPWLPNIKFSRNGFVLLSDGGLRQVSSGALISVPFFDNMSIEKLDGNYYGVSGATCVLTTGKRMYCWGHTDNFFSSFPNAPTPFIQVTAPIEITVSGKTIKDMSVGTGIHLLFTDNTIYGWGLCSSYSVGVCTSTTKITTPTALTAKLPTGKTWKKVLHNGSASFALTTSGEVYAWGSALNGALGDGTTANKMNPVKLTYPAAVSDMVGGENFAIAVLNDGRIFAHGTNVHGQVVTNTGSNNQILSPTQVVLPDTVTSVFTANFRSYAILSNGKVYGWGYNSANVISTSSVSPVPPTEIPISNVTNIVAPSLASLFMCSDGNKYVLGDNLNGYFYMGSNPGQVRRVPTHMSSDIDDGSIEQINSGSAFAFVLKSNSSVITGFGSNIAFGLGTTVNGKIDQSTVNTSALQGEKIKSFVTGSMHSYILTESGNLFAFGSGLEYQLGNGANDDSANLVKVNLTNVVGKINYVCAGYQHGVVVDDQNNVYTWGRNSNYALGNGAAPDDISLPTKINTNIIGTRSIIQLSCTFEHTLLLTSDSQIYAFGPNSGGFLGINNTDVVTSVVKTVDTMFQGSTIYKVLAGNEISLAASTNGQLYVWGSRGSLQFKTYPDVHPELTSILTGANLLPVDFTITSSTIMVGLSNGSIAISGTNSFGLMGVGLGPAVAMTALIAPSDDYKYVKRIAGTGNSAYALFCKTLPNYPLPLPPAPSPQVSQATPVPTPSPVPAVSSSPLQPQASPSPQPVPVPTPLPSSVPVTPDVSPVASPSPIHPKPSLRVSPTASPMPVHSAPAIASPKPSPKPVVSPRASSVPAVPSPVASPVPHPSPRHSPSPVHSVPAPQVSQIAPAVSPKSSPRVSHPAPTPSTSRAPVYPNLSPVDSLSPIHPKASPRASPTPAVSPRASPKPAVSPKASPKPVVPVASSPVPPKGGVTIEDTSFESWINPNLPFAITPKVRLTTANVGVTSYQWSSTDIALNSDTLMAPVNQANLIFRSGALTKSAYQITFQVRSSVLGSASAVYTIRTASIPSSGSCTATPSSGVALSTKFVINCSGWESGVGNNAAVSYKFALQVGQGSPSDISSQLSTDRVETQLPSGDNVAIVVTVTNAVALVATRRIPVVVASNNDAKAIETSIDNALSQVNIDQSAVTISVIAASLMNSNTSVHANLTAKMLEASEKLASSSGVTPALCTASISALTYVLHKTEAINQDTSIKSINIINSVSNKCILDDATSKQSINVITKLSDTQQPSVVNSFISAINNVLSSHARSLAAGGQSTVQVSSISAALVTSSPNLVVAAQIVTSIPSSHGSTNVSISKSSISGLSDTDGFAQIAYFHQSKTADNQASQGVLHVMLVRTSNGSAIGTPKDVTFEIQGNYTANTAKSNVTLTCERYDAASATWASSGCSLVSSDSTSAKCYCAEGNEFRVTKSSVELNSPDLPVPIPAYSSSSATTGSNASSALAPGYIALIVIASIVFCLLLLILLVGLTILIAFCAKKQKSAKGSSRSEGIEMQNMSV